MRDELKYILPVDRLPAVRAALAPFMRLDAYGEEYRNVGYTVRSIYLDSTSLRYYHEKKGHLQHRKKIRLRGYNDGDADDTAFLEIKRKSNDVVSKERAKIEYAHVPSLFETGNVEAYLQNGQDAAVGRRMCYHVFRHDLRPTCLVVYEREAFEGRFDETFRVTLDRNIRSVLFPELDELFEPDGLIEAVPGHFVMEVKFNTRMPAWMRQVIAEFGLMQRALSKYCVCVDAFDRRIDTTSAVRASATPIVAGRAESLVYQRPRHDNVAEEVRSRH